jgi:hypothetical protein
MAIPEILVDEPCAVLKIEILISTKLADTKKRELHSLVFCEVVGVCQTDAIDPGDLRVGADQRRGLGESVGREVKVCERVASVLRRT